MDVSELDLQRRRYPGTSGAYDAINIGDTTSYQVDGSYNSLQKPTSSIAYLQKVGSGTLHQKCNGGPVEARNPSEHVAASPS